MTKKAKKRPDKRDRKPLRLEQFEPRQCLSAIALVSHLIVQNDVHGPANIRMADIDGDRDLDIVTGSFYDHKLAWFENSDGSDDFAPLHTIDEDDITTSVFEVGDLDGDGDTDIVFGTYFNDGESPLGQSELGWRENDGSGGFGPKQVIDATEGFIRRIKLGDVDGDGDTDVVSINQDSGEIAWHEATSEGVGPKHVFPTKGNPRSVHLADLDGDQDLDAIVRFRDNDVEWFENVTGSGDFSESHIVVAESFPLDIGLADMDGDSDIDILTEQGWYANDGSGSFAAPTAFDDIGELNDIDHDVEVDAADFDGDGDLDVVLSEGNFIAWYENTDGSGTLGPRQTITTQINDGSFVFTGVGLAVGDLDGDEITDVASLSFSDHRIAWYQNTGGAFGSQQVISTTVAWLTSTEATDLDGDGDLDMISSSSDDQKIAWYENVDGEFGPQRVLSTDVSGVEFVDMSDMDGDGDLDLYYAAFGDDKVAWWPYIGGEEIFGAEQVITQDSDGVFSALIEDLDGDGHPDVLTTSFLDQTIAWHQGDGTGNYGPRQVIERIQTGIWPDLGDVDGDGDLDLIVSDPDNAELKWYRNDGAANFELADTIFTEFEFSPGSLESDLDQDGDLDLVTSENGTFSWHENNDGVFGTEHVIVNDFGAIWSWQFDDFDGDGDKDLIAASGQTDMVAWFENLDGLGSFGPAIEISSGTGIDTINVDDLDGDGDLDVTGISRSKVIWYENRIIGDSNNDGVFDSTDLTAVFTAGKYDDGIANNTTFDEGDWNQDGDFDSTDIVLAFQVGHYVGANQSEAAEFAIAVDSIYTQRDHFGKSQAFSTELTESANEREM